MFNTPNNKITSAMIKRNDRRSIANTDTTYNEASGPMHGGAICKTCGGKIRIKMKDVVSGLKTVGKMAKPIVHQAIKKGAIGLGTAVGSYFGAPEVGAVAGNEIGNIASLGYDKAVGGKMKKSSRHTKGTKSKTMKGKLDYTTKLGDAVYHIGGHDIKKIVAPYTGAGMKKGMKSLSHIGDMDYTTKKGDMDYHEDGHNVKKSSKPYSKPSKWIDFVKQFAKDHNMKYGQALSSTECKSSYHNSK